MTPTTETSAPIKGATEVTFKKRAFDLNKFERVSLEGKFTYVPVTSLEEAMAKVDNDTEKFMDLVNAGLKREQLMDAKASLTLGDPNIVASAKAIMQFAANFKAVPPYSKIADKKEQKKAIFAFIRSNEGLMAALRTIAAATPDVADDEDEDDEA